MDDPSNVNQPTAHRSQVSDAPSAAKRLVVALIRGYQRYISPLLGPRCRFEPTCSHYAEQAIHRYGLSKGAWMALKRLLRCQPFSRGGYDPLPETQRASHTSNSAKR